ncbi:MAG: hypothetical protein ACLTGB_12055 [Blautia caecimuris]
MRKIEPKQGLYGGNTNFTALKTKKVSGTDLTSITPSEMLDLTPRKAESET